MNLVVISGKGGTGKTTIASSFAYLNKNGIALDCDVDAANLYLMMESNEKSKNAFSGAKVAIYDRDLCIKCGKCINVCKYNAITYEDGINELLCEGCGACEVVCENNAMRLEDEETGNILLEDTKNGLLSRGELYPGAEGSGRMVTEVRRVASEYINNEHLNIIDSSPGIGCQVIASIVGNDVALIVTEPTMSGMNDLTRTVELLNMFGIKGLVCVNQFDINMVIAQRITEYCNKNDIEVIGLIPFDPMVKESINMFKPVVAFDGPASTEIKKMFNRINKMV